jgi:MFS superfamily sulfate permease-like transporter
MAKRVKILKGYGMSNLFGSFMSSYAGSGSFTRSGLNYASGAKLHCRLSLRQLF